MHVFKTAHEGGTLLRREKWLYDTDFIGHVMTASWNLASRRICESKRCRHIDAIGLVAVVYMAATPWNFN
jgi:hypothetical protein